MPERHEPPQKEHLFRVFRAFRLTYFLLAAPADKMREFDTPPYRVYTVTMEDKQVPVNDEILKIKEVILRSVDCEQVFLFGSYAYGTPTADSDYDFYVVLKDDSPVKPIAAMQIISRSLMDFDTRVAIDVLANYKTRFEYRSTQPTIERRISKEGVLLYG